jgi:ubiquinone/menaquinone biosynthesis C-methylase UbiE
MSKRSRAQAGGDDRTILPFARRAFGLAAEAYRRSRPTYPAAAIDWIADSLDLGPGRTVLEVGAGTGRFTELLVPTGVTIVAVEPVAEMRSALESALPGIRVIDASAESLPLPDASVDAIVAAQAFHWFDTGPALGEFHRVLRPSGRLAVVWNARDTDVDWVRELEGIIDAYASAAPQFGDAREQLDESPLFNCLTSAEFRHTQTLDPATLLTQVASISYIAALDENARQVALDRVRTLVGSHPQLAGRQLIEQPYRTYAHSAVRVERAPEPDRPG